MWSRCLSADIKNAGALIFSSSFFCIHNNFKAALRLITGNLSVARLAGSEQTTSDTLQKLQKLSNEVKHKKIQQIEEAHMLNYLQSCSVNIRPENKDSH